MENYKKQLEELAEIRSLMEKSSRFLSLSGLSGIFAGTFAIMGALNVWLFTGQGNLKYDIFFGGLGESVELPVLRFIVINALMVLVLSIFFAWFFSWKKAKRMNMKLWNAATKRMLVNLFIPLVAGGILCIILLFRLQLNLLVPMMLIFYGLALVNAGKYTEMNINYLGLAEILTGLLGVIFINSSLLFWTLGFGVWHIVYGILMYYVQKRTW